MGKKYTKDANRDKWIKQIQFWGTRKLGYADSGLWRFLQHVTTRDPLAESPYRKIPLGKEYIQWVFRTWLACDRVVVPKSRQVMMSWLACIFCCWYARTKQERKIMWQGKKEDDALDMVTHGGKEFKLGRMSFIESRLPPWLMDYNIVTGNGNKQGCLVYTQTDKCPYTGLYVPWEGSEIRAVPQGEHQVRSHTPSLYIIDEAAFQDDFYGAFTTALPAVQRIIALSSAAQGGFADLVLEGEEMRSWAA